MEVKLPRLGEGADSGTVASIFVREGDEVKKDQPILELESEKAVASIPSPAAGTITRIHVKEGEEVKVGQLLVSIADSGAVAPASAKGKGEEAKREAPRTVRPTNHEPIPLEEAPPLEMDTAERKSAFPPPASPTIRKMAKELGIDLTRVRGSERGGRIVLADLRRYIRQLQERAFTQEAPTLHPAEKPAPVSTDFSTWGPVTKQKMTTLRRAISKKMVESWTTIPHVTQFDEADITSLLKLRKKYAAAYEKKGAHLTVTTFVLKAVVDTLKKHPKFNSSLDEATGEIVQKEYYHVGIAVDTEHGLIVPVIRDVDKKSQLQLSIELGELAERTRQRKVALEEMQGGTFTISNQGGIGGAHFTPIINKPEVAILGIGRGVVKPVVHKNKMEQHTLLPLGLSYDHRVIDGADAARFISDLVEALGTFRESDVAVPVDAAKTRRQ